MKTINTAVKICSLGIVVVAAAASLGGCGSKPTRADSSRDEAKAQAIRDEANQERMNKKQAILQKEANAVPDWVISPPKADSQGVYGVGIGSDADMMTAMRKARLQGAYELAKAMNAELSAEDTMIGSGEGEYRYIVSLFVNKVNVAGTELIEQDIKPINGVFKSYVLLKLPFAEFNHALKAQRASSQKAELEEAYNRLMKRIATTPVTPAMPVATAIPAAVATVEAPPAVLAKENGMQGNGAVTSGVIAVPDESTEK